MKRIRAFAAALILALSIACTFSGCNKQIVDLHYNFKDAMIKMPDGTVISGTLESWTDYENSDQIQVKIDGVTYLVHSANCVLYN